MTELLPRDELIITLPPIPPRTTLADWVALLRPRQWIKNFVIFAGLLFSGRLLDPASITVVGGVFLLFCLISSAGYCINDVLDRDRDRLHPRKRHRPVAAGRIAPGAACALAGGLLLLGMLAAWRCVGPTAVWLGLAYLALTLSYSLHWKHYANLELMVITAGFVLRAFAGTVVLHVILSPWLFICVFFLSLMLGLGKRRHELFILQSGEELFHRPVLSAYSIGFVDQAMSMMASSSIITYSIYCVASPSASHYPSLVFTVPLVVYAILRYLYLVLHHQQGGQPEEVFLTDRQMIITLLLWAGAIVGIITRWH